MIVISRDKNQVVVNIESGVLNYTYNFKMNFCDEVHAELLNQAFNKRMEAKLEQIRREAYNQGWKDKSAHRKKETWFSKWWRN